jgi:pimeloyl-ACP methyl ester carboxylesterase
MARVLLVHGLNSNPQNWWRVRGWLESAGWDVETATLLGHDGRDPAPDYSLTSYVDDLITHAPGPWDLVVAHSLGGSTATVAAAADPRWTARLILLDPVWLITDDEWDEVIADQVSELSLTEATLITAKPHWHPDDVAAKLVAVAAVDTDAASRTFTDTGRWDLREHVAKLAIPTLVLAGDPAVYSMLQPGLGAGNPSIETHVVAGAGHSPHRDEPEATRIALSGWL